MGIRRRRRGSGATAETATTDTATKKGKRSDRPPEKRVKRAIQAGKVLAPVLAPYAMRAAGAAREGIDRARARKLGVEVDALPRFSGKGAALHARILGTDRALQDLRQNSHNEHLSDSGESFVTGAENRLADLTSAVRAAERMPAGRRRAVHRAVAGELDAVDTEVLRRLGLGLDRGSEGSAAGS